MCEFFKLSNPKGCLIFYFVVNFLMIFAFSSDYFDPWCVIESRMGGLKENINACLIEGASNFQGSFHKNLMYLPIFSKEKFVNSYVTR